MKAAIFIAILTTCHAQYWTIFDGDQTSPRPRVCEDEARTFNDRAALADYLSSEPTKYSSATLKVYEAREMAFDVTVSSKTVDRVEKVRETVETGRTVTIEGKTHKFPPRQNTFGFGYSIPELKTSITETK